jgi:hypothetical protein
MEPAFIQRQWYNTMLRREVNSFSKELFDAKRLNWRQPLSSQALAAEGFYDRLFVVGRDREGDARC